MKIIIGTKNEIKINALKEVVLDYDFLEGSKVEGVDTGSLVADQPKSLDETILGARNRAAAAFKKGDLGVGIEDGLMAVSQSATGFINICVCVFYDGNKFYLGTSAGFEYPPKAIELVGKGLDINQAFYEMGLTDNHKIGSSVGAIGILTKGRWVRSETVKQAITAALVQLDNKDIY